MWRLPAAMSVAPVAVWWAASPRGDTGDRPSDSARDVLLPGGIRGHNRTARECEDNDAGDTDKALPTVPPRRPLHRSRRRRRDRWSIILDSPGSRQLAFQQPSGDGSRRSRSGRKSSRRQHIRRSGRDRRRVWRNRLPNDPVAGLSTAVSKRRFESGTGGAPSTASVSGQPSRTWRRATTFTGASGGRSSRPRRWATATSCPPRGSAGCWPPC